MRIRLDPGDNTKGNTMTSIKQLAHAVRQLAEKQNTSADQIIDRIRAEAKLPPTYVELPLGALVLKDDMPHLLTIDYCSQITLVPMNGRMPYRPAPDKRPDQVLHLSALDALRITTPIDVKG